MPVGMTLAIHSKMEELNAVQAFVEQLNNKVRFNEDRLSDVTLALCEVVTNAIKHGHKEDVNKKVFLQAQLFEHELHIQVDDEGNGFNPAEVANPTNDENILKTSGRGIYLIRQLCDDVIYSEKGNRVTLIFQR
ncbi:MAG: ATP-binding protein [Balneolales bacterium]